MQNILRIIPKKRNRISIINRSSYSGSNAVALYNYLCENQAEIVEARLINNFPSAHLGWNNWKWMASSQIIIGTHDPFKFSKKQVFIQLWHGIPLKRMGFLAKNTENGQEEKTHKRWQKEVDYITSSSDIYDTLMSASLGLNNNKFIYTGFPRIDAFRQTTQQIKEKKEQLLELFTKEVTKKNPDVLCYLPTFRLEDSSNELSEMIVNGNIFGLADLSMETIEEELTRKNIVIIAKLHPVEAKQIDITKFNQYGHIKVIQDTFFEENRQDLYEFLPATSGLITDYSSVYFDYLLLNKPITFLVGDLEKYEKTRGFLLSPYRDFAPGKLITDENQFVEFITNWNQDDEMGNFREIIKREVFSENINQTNASANVWNKIIKDII